jgi:hypothetical protein
MGIRARMATIRMWIRRKKHHKPIVDQRTMWRTEGLVGDVNAYECNDGDDVDANVEE